MWLGQSEPPMPLPFMRGVIEYRRQKNKKKPKQKCQNWAFKMTKKKKKASTKVSNGEFAVLPQ